MARLPVPGSDRGTWGAVLNDFLDQSHDAAGLLKPDSVGTAQIADSAVTSAKIADGTLTDGDISASAAIAQSKVANLEIDLSARVNNAVGQSLTLWKGTASAYAAISVPDSNTIYVIVG